MIIILKKDGTVVTDGGNPVEGAKLENAAAVLADPKDGDTIVYDATAGMWVAGTSGDSFEPDITNPQDGDTLVYDASEEKWVNGSGGGSGGGYLKVSMDMEGTLDKTWQEIHDALAAGYFVSIIGTMGNIVTSNIVTNCYSGLGGTYGVKAISTDGNTSYEANSENGYPAMQSDLTPVVPGS